MLAFFEGGYRRIGTVQGLGFACIPIYNRVGVESVLSLSESYYNAEMCPKYFDFLK